MIKKRSRDAEGAGGLGGPGGQGGPDLVRELGSLRDSVGPECGKEKIQQIRKVGREGPKVQLVREGMVS